MEIDEGGVIEQTTINKRTHIIKKLGTRRYIISVLMDDTLVIQQSEGGIVVCA